MSNSIKHCWNFKNCKSDPVILDLPGRGYFHDWKETHNYWLLTSRQVEAKIFGWEKFFLQKVGLHIYLQNVEYRLIIPLSFSTSYWKSELFKLNGIIVFKKKVKSLQKWLPKATVPGYLLLTVSDKSTLLRH